MLDGYATFGWWCIGALAAIGAYIVDNPYTGPTPPDM